MLMVSSEVMARPMASRLQRMVERHSFKLNSNELANVMATLIRMF